MLEEMGYTFFDEALANRFANYCEQQSVVTELEFEETHSGEQAYHVQVVSEMSDEVMSLLEDRYNELFFGDQAALIEGNDEAGALADACGIQVMLSSGEYTTLAVHPEIMNKLLSVLSLDELQGFLAQVVADIEHPKSGPICSRTDLPSR